jgi:hypothetical protein
MDLLTDAIASIRVGVTDSRSSEHERLPSAIRSIYAGVLLLYKEALRRLSPPNSGEGRLKTNIFPKLDSRGVVIFEGRGKKAVDVRQIRERFAGVGITTDWRRFDRLSFGLRIVFGENRRRRDTYVACPECLAEAYVIEERRCALCEHAAEHTCARCSNEIPPEELGTSPLCGYCEHVMSKDD